MKRMLRGIHYELRDYEPQSLATFALEFTAVGNDFATHAKRL
jgi:hypothetical protein